MTHARQVFGTRGVRLTAYNSEMRARDRIKHVPARSSDESVAVGHRIADALLPSQDKCSLREILESVDPSAELIVSEP
jgi:hypothetical protein